MGRIVKIISMLEFWPNEAYNDCALDTRFFIDTATVFYVADTAMKPEGGGWGTLRSSVSIPPAGYKAMIDILDKLKYTFASERLRMPANAKGKVRLKPCRNFADCWRAHALWQMDVQPGKV